MAVTRSSKRNSVKKKCQTECGGVNNSPLPESDNYKPKLLDDETLSDPVNLPSTQQLTSIKEEITDSNDVVQHVEPSLNMAVMCHNNNIPDRQNVKDDFSISTLASFGKVTNQKPKFRSLSLKKKRSEVISDDPSAPSCKRACFEPTEADHSTQHFAPGLKNLGNSCYVNSALQVLYHTPRFKESLSCLSEVVRNLEDDVEASTNEMNLPGKSAKMQLVECLDKLFSLMDGCQKQSSTPIDTSSVLEIVELLNPLFQVGRQQDVHEFFLGLLSFLQEAVEEVNALKKKLNLPTESTSSRQPGRSEPAEGCKEAPADQGGSCKFWDATSGKIAVAEGVECQPGLPAKSGRAVDFVSELYKGTMERVTRCLECESESKTSESFQDLRLSLKTSRPVAVKHSMLTDRDDDDVKNNNISSDEDDDEGDYASKMVKALSEIEKLDSCNKFYCLVCDHLVEAERRIRFVRCPELLVVHLQRFASFYGAGTFSKVMENTGIPLEMNFMEDGCLGKTHRFNLFAIISHSGFSLTSGHYIAYIKVSGHYSDAAADLKDINSSTPEQTANPDTKPSNELENNNLTTNDTEQIVLKTSSEQQVWLECNDHRVRKLKTTELEKLIGPEYSSNNPYMLFYSRD